METTESVRSAVEDHDWEASAITILVDELGTAVLLDAIRSSVASGEWLRRAWALKFLQDSILFGQDRRMHNAFATSELLSDLRSAATAGDYALRQQAIHLLGRLGPRANRATLIGAVPWLVEHDPLHLHDLYIEIQWLTGIRKFKARPYLSDWARSRDPLVRWATLAILCQRQLATAKPRQVPGWAVQLLRRLAQDPTPGSVTMPGRRWPVGDPARATRSGPRPT